MPEREARNPWTGFTDAVINLIDGPVVWFRGNNHYFNFHFI